MTGHDYHPGLPGYAPAQLLHAGCGECETRAGALDCGLGSLDMTRFAEAWARAAAWRGENARLADLGRVEVPMLAALWAVQVQLEKFGLPIGYLPAGPGLVHHLATLGTPDER